MTRGKVPTATPARATRAKTAAAQQDYVVKDIGLADFGRVEIQLA